MALLLDGRGGEVDVDALRLGDEAADHVGEHGRLQGQAADLVVADDVDEVLRAQQQGQLAEVHLGHQHLVVALQHVAEVVREGVQVAQVRLRDVVAGLAHAAYAGADRAVRRSPAQHEHSGVSGGVLDLERGDGARDGIDPVLRQESAKITVDLEFDGYGIGGLSVGETREEMLVALSAAIEHLPKDRPRYLMGVGDPASLVEAVNLGVDQFDCVMQTRIGRHGTALTSVGKLNITRAEFATSQDPIDLHCACPVCKRHTRGYIRHLFQVNEPTAARLVSIHNIAFTLNLMKQMRDAIANGEFSSLRKSLLAVWADTANDKA